MKRKRPNSLRELAKRIHRELLPDEEGDELLLIDRKWEMDQTRGLCPDSAQELCEFHKGLCRVIPKDFDFWVSFENGTVAAQLIYEDGKQTGYGGRFPVRLDDQIFANLHEVNWDELRGSAIKANQFHDSVGDLAEDYPVQWIPSAAIHETYRAEIENYMKWLIDVGQVSGVLAGDTENLVLMNCTIDEPDHRDRWISEQMGQGHLIIAVVENGVLLSAEETENLRRIELQKLPRIAKAKAEGRFQPAMEAMGTPFKS